MRPARYFWITAWLLLAAVAIASFQWHCNNAVQQPIISTHTDTLYITNTDTLKLKSLQKVPVPVYMEPEIIPADVDTQAILQLFYTRVVYQDTASDSLLWISLIDTIAQNKIVGRGFKYHIKQPQQIIIHNTIVQYADSSRKLFAGVGIGNRNALPAPAILYMDKKSRLYQVQWQPASNGHSELKFTLMLPLKRKK